ncbi:MULTISPECIES: hypothetical protein [Caproicibacterium]|uniref:Uncharacterized protein n=1 Tax=Caproicibacterium argilliputei TaxID=3030016 RepID=A0AA97DBT2_9FIRM|nr:hypothetical protein [Caproicibacterium argilliputei]WOC33372.1 hypothetical protein PXC00_05755 [Caproicibacterium argilliputei]
MKKILKLQFYNMLRGKSFYFALLLMCGLTAAFMLQSISTFINLDQTLLRPAWYLWYQNAVQSLMDRGSTSGYMTLLGMTGFLLLPFVAVLGYGASYYDGLKTGTVKSVLSRTSQKAYFVSGAIVTFTGAFLVILIPYVFEQMILLILCAGAPQQNAAALSPVMDNWGYWLDVPEFLWSLQMNHPVLFDLLCCLNPAMVGGAFAVLTYSLSLFIHKNRFLVLTLPGILLWFLADYVIGMTKLTGKVTTLSSLVQFSSMDTYVLWPVYVLVLLLISDILIYFKCHVKKDVLE